MSDSKILDIFYNEIVPEAANGKVDCYFILSIAFNLTVNNQVISKSQELGLISPTLRITNKALFDCLLVEYVNKAIAFYSPSDFSFLNYVNPKEGDLTKEEYLIRYIIGTLLANASLNDFDNPIRFLQSRIAMFDNRLLKEEVLDLGYIQSIKARLCLTEEISPIKAETPYRLKCYVEFDDGYKLVLPEIYAGYDGKKYQIYGIQKTTESNALEERLYLKQIRKGMIAKINGAPEHYFLASMIFLSLCREKEIEVIPFLVERWNAKKVAMENRTRRNSNITPEVVEEEQDKIQSNLTDGLIRYFTKLEDVTNGMNFTSFPSEADHKLHIRIEPEAFLSRSLVFNEIFNLVQEKNKTNNRDR